MERTLVIIKPDALQRGLAGVIISRLEQRGLRIAALRMFHIDEALAARHYAEHVEKPFYRTLVDFITSSPVISAVVEVPDAVEVVRATMVATDSRKAAHGAILAVIGCYIT